MTKKMNAKFAGKCAACGGYFKAGTPIGYDTATRKAAHTSCPAVPGSAPVYTKVPADTALARLAEVTTEAKALRAAVYKARYAALKDAYTAWREAGGCSRCNGSDSVRVMSDVWESCGCGTSGNYPPRMETVRLPELANAVVATLNFRATELEREADGLREKLTLKRFATVTVTRGRKVPKGTTGSVIWIGEGRYGARVGVKDDAGTVHWTAAKNVDVTEYEEAA